MAFRLSLHGAKQYGIGANQNPDVVLIIRATPAVTVIQRSTRTGGARVPIAPQVRSRVRAKQSTI